MRTDVSVVTGQAPVQYGNSVGLLDPPPDQLRDEPLVLRVALDDLDTQLGTMQDDLFFEALVDHSLVDAAAGVLGDLVQHDDTASQITGKPQVGQAGTWSLRPTRQRTGPVVASWGLRTPFDPPRRRRGGGILAT